jgi:hypothetical protein
MLDSFFTIDVNLFHVLILYLLSIEKISTSDKNHNKRNAHVEAPKNRTGNQRAQPQGMRSRQVCTKIRAIACASAFGAERITIRIHTNRHSVLPKHEYIKRIIPRVAFENIFKRSFNFNLIDFKKIAMLQDRIFCFSKYPGPEGSALVHPGGVI